MHATKKRLLSLLMALVLCLSLAVPAFAAGGETHITILGTSDMHADIWGYDYADNRETSNTGMARAYTYIQQVRAEEENVLLVDAGDDIQGTIMTDDIYNKDLSLQHPVMAAMNAMGYDAMTLGNHEFNWGVPAMQTITGQATFPVLCANVLDKDGKPVTGQGWTIVEKAGVKIAIIGVDTPYVPLWDGGKDGIDDCTYLDADKAVAAAIGEIGDQADIIMVSAHMGVESEFDPELAPDSGAKIIETNPEVDLLQLGHAHTTVNTEIEGVPVAAVQNLCKEIARWDLTLNAQKEIVDCQVSIVPMSDVEPSQEIRDLDIVKEAQEKTIQYVTGNVLGSTTAKFQPEDEVKGIASGRIMDTAVMDLINKVQMEKADADVSAAALFKATSDLPEGEILYNNIFDIYKFDNTLYRVNVTGAELKSYMEWAAGCWNQWIPGDVTISFNPDMPDYLHDLFAGVDYEVDLSQPAGSRIKNVMFHGAPLQDDQILKLAVNNYRYSSKVDSLVEAEPDWQSSESIRDMLVAYFAEHSPVAPEVDNNWKIVGVDLQTGSAERAAAIAKVNSGEAETPLNKSINLDGKVAVSAATLTDGNGTIYYRLRDVAFDLRDTGFRFNLAWQNGVIVVTGGDYTAEALEEPVEGTPVADAIAITVDGTRMDTPVLLLNGNYYVSAESLTSLLGTSFADFNTLLIAG